jgi:iron complex transport system substrate-binding protein
MIPYLNRRQFFLSVVVVSLLALPAPSWCKTFKDSLGRDVELTSSPKRIIPLAPSLTEILYYLGLGDKVAGVTEYSYYPPEAAQKPSVGSYIDPNVEKIISLSPDLVIGTKDGNMPGSIYLLDEAKIPAYVVDPRNVEDAVSTIDKIGDLCGVSERAHQLTDKLKKRLEAVQNAVASKKKPVVFLQINVSPIMTVNRNTFHNDLIRLAGGINMAADEAITYPRISLEEVIKKKPDIIIISSMEIGGEFERAKKEWMKWTSIPAVKNNRVYLIDSDIIDRPSQRIIDGLEAMARLIHPEVDWDKLKELTPVSK